MFEKDNLIAIFNIFIKSYHTFTGFLLGIEDLTRGNLEISFLKIGNFSVWSYKKKSYKKLLESPLFLEVTNHDGGRRRASERLGASS